MPIQIYALIKKSSAYYHHQHTDGKPFQVTFDPNGLPSNLYVVHGNQNHYRMSDLNFFVQLSGRFVKL